ncbi:MAG: 4-hydroxy-tetrahydrodipicolinate synthase [Spirochaetales bacterium]|nr:4-hydroxy-tetrahydrodipicolinate synthase [Spirochaetales bacterium]
MFKGVYTALVTPFNEDGSIDEGALRKLVDVQIQGGVNGLVPMGTTGESPTVDHDENIQVIEIVVDQAKKRVPIIAGTGSNSTEEAVRMTRRAKDCGADATLQVAPYYNKPNQEGFYRHFMEVADKGGLPVIVYNIPGRTGKNIENSTTLRLARHSEIVAVKEASGDLNQVMDIIAQKPEGFDVLSGDDNLIYPFMALGAAGVISVASNLIPDQMSAFLNQLLAGKYQDALKTHYRLLPLFKAMFIDTNPIPIKAALAMTGSIKEVYRLPMCSLSIENKQKLQGVLKEFAIL